MNAINTFFDWIARLALLNVLWIVFTVLGLGVFGFFPALSASFAVSRKWVSGETDIPVVRSFWKYYKRDFLKSNGLGYVLSIIAYILYLDFVFLTVSPSNFVDLLTIPFVLISIIFVLMILYAFPVFVHYQMKLLEVIKSAFFIMILNPLPTLIMIIGVIGISVILYFLQGLIIFFGVSVLSVVIMMPAYRAFQNVETKNRMTMENTH